MQIQSLSVVLGAFSDAFSTETPYFYLIWAFAIGFFLAIVLSFLHRLFVGRIARALLAEKIHTPEQAKSLASLGCDGILYRFLLRNGATLRKIIVRAPMEGETSMDSALPTPEDRFYIPTDKTYRAQSGFTYVKGSLWQVVLAAPVLFVLALAIFAVLPYFLP